MLDVGVFLLKGGEKLHKTRLSQVEVSFKGNLDKGSNLVILTPQDALCTKCGTATSVEERQRESGSRIVRSFEPKSKREEG